MFPPLITLWEEEEELTSQAYYCLYIKQTTTTWGQFPDYGAIRVPIGGKIVLLNSDAAITAGTTKTLEIARTSGDYQNSTGVDSHAVIIVGRNGGASPPTFKLRASNTADTADGTVLYDQTVGLGVEFLATEVVDVPDTKFLTIEVAAGTVDVHIAMVVEDA